MTATVQSLCRKHQGVELRLEFDDQVYQPGSLTADLGDLMRVNPGERVADIGCGTGYLGILSALLGAGHVIASDPVAAAVRWTRHNAHLNAVTNVDARLGGALDPIDEPVDLILSLPPQMPFAGAFNLWRHGGKDGTEVIGQILRQASERLRPGGRMYLVHAALANPARVRALIDRSGFSLQIVHCVEKNWTREEATALHPELYEYILELARRGQAELTRQGSRYVYPVWFYLLRSPSSGTSGQP